MAETKTKPTAEEQAIADQQAQTKDILDAQLNDKGIIEKLEGRLSQKDVEIQQLTEELAEAEALIGEQQLALSSQEDSSEKIHVTHQGQKYQVATPRFRLDGRTYEAAELRDDKTMVARLVELNSSVLSAVIPEAKAAKAKK